jgi:hypothetical protein
MANTRGLGPVFWHGMKYPVKPPVLIDPSETQEIDEPFRRGRGYAIRFPFTKHALVVGLWQSSHNESEALTYAISGRAMKHEEVDWDALREMGDDIDV